ncbi:sigma-70 family RNA polymerase sigma factor [Dyella psychrodurans]|uniref:RNA polymerase subunit sigma n=1 Tax=Dyella psychrodurans TaxID=1927960 RepID=A0A370XAW5_9GAMM|nr:sigma-70 family RNA polymerase sigma factor [Dyella psychrodurans]RDS85536.1 RNA polymerase subunit sigma [Dyella psychrodurans]
MPADFHRIASGRPAAGSTSFEAQVLPYLDAAYNLARWLARDDADAQDVVQEAMLRAFRYFDSFRGGDARVWLLAIVRNTFYSLRMKVPPDGMQETFDDDAHAVVDEQPTPEARMLIALDVGALQKALENLPHPLRETIVLRELEECSYKEIASITGQKIGTVMSRLARARERLRAELTRHSTEVRRHDVQ